MSTVRVGCCSQRILLYSLAHSRRAYASAAAAASPTYNAYGYKEAPKSRKRKKRTQKSAYPEDSTPPVTLLDDSTVHKFLEHLKATKHTIAVDEVERFHPKTVPEPEDDQYEVKYRKLQDEIANAFSVKQLLHFLRLYQVNPPDLLVRDKWTCAAMIIEQAWQYPALSEVVAKRQDRTVQVTQSFPLDPRQSFLLLGRDGSDLSGLSRKYNVKMTLSANPLALKATGFQGSIKGLGKHIASFKENICDEVYELPTRRPVRADLLQRVSRLAGAFTENHADGQIRVTYKANAPKSILMAKRLATRASCESPGIDHPDLFAYVPPPVVPTETALSVAPATYALYPFLSSRSLPWTIAAGAAFRLRRIGEWFGYGYDKNLPKFGTLFRKAGHMLSLSEEHSDIRSLLQGLGAFEQDNTVTASLGHVLITTPPTSRTLTPPISGNFYIPDLFSWLRSVAPSRVFIPSIPAALIENTSSTQTVLHRLIYRSAEPEQEDDKSREATSSRTLTFEIFLEQRGKAKKTEAEIKALAVEGLMLQKAQSASKEMSFEEQLRDMEEQEGKPRQTPSKEQRVRPAEDIPSTDLQVEEERQNLTYSCSCTLGLESSVNVMLPDRQVDMQLSVINNTEVLQAAWPEEIAKYVNDLSAYIWDTGDNVEQPQTPLSFACNGEQFILNTSASVRQHRVDFNGTTNAAYVTESLLDLESSHKSNACKVVCRNAASDEEWNAFVESCDGLTSSDAWETS